MEEVQNHLWEMLEAGALWPSWSAWCNAMVLGRKKDGGLQFCIDFCCLNKHMKKDSYPLPRIQEALESLVGARPQIRVLANKNRGGIQTIYHLQSRQFGIFQMQLHAFWAMQHASHISETDAKLSQWVKPHILSNLPSWHNLFLADSGGAPP